jgi:TetR/AcrR family transcriptional regulator, transcriptional repressor of bet genes
LGWFREVEQMPKVGMKPVRRRQLIDAAIASIHEYGFADATVARIAAKAGVSPGIVHHYFTDKDDLLFATMRRMLAELRADLLAGLARARSPQGRLDAVIEASFAPAQFTPDVMAAWLALYGNAGQSPKLARIVRLYHRRLRSMLAGPLRELARAPEADALAEGIAAMIDGLYLRCALAGNVALEPPDTAAERARSLALAKGYVAATLNREGHS